MFKSQSQSITSITIILIVVGALAAVGVIYYSQKHKISPPAMITPTINQPSTTNPQFNAEKWAKSISGYKEIPVLNEVVVAQGQTGDGNARHVMVYYDPSGKQASFVWKDCKGESEECQGITKATFIYLFDKDGKFINASTESKKIKVEGILKKGNWPNNYGYGPIIELTKVEVIN